MAWNNILNMKYMHTLYKQFPNTWHWGRGGGDINMPISSYSSVMPSMRPKTGYPI